MIENPASAWSPRRSVVVGGFAHENPIPAASRIGPFIFSGAITARSAPSGEMPEGLDAQASSVFEHMREIVEASGATLDDIIKVTVWLAEYRDRAALNREWLAAFPRPTSRPARQVVAATLDRGTLIQCDFVAIATG